MGIIIDGKTFWEWELENMFDGVHKITVSTSAPLEPQIGDLWIDIS